MGSRRGATRESDKDSPENRRKHRRRKSVEAKRKGKVQDGLLTDDYPGVSVSFMGRKDSDGLLSVMF